MASNRKKLEEIASLYQAAGSVTWDGDNVFRGDIEIDADAPAWLSEIDQFGLDLELKQQGVVIPPSHIAQLAPGTTVQFTIRRPTFQHAYFAKSFGELLGNFDNTYEEPAAYFLADQQLLVDRGDDTDDSQILAYRAVLRLISLFNEHQIADHMSDGRERELLFLGHEKKLNMTLRFATDNLASSEEIVGAVDKLERFLGDAVHPADKQLMVKKTVIEMLSSHGEGVAFAYLIDHLGDFVRRCKGNFELYIGKYTFDDEKQKLLVEIRDYFRAVNDAIASAQLRLIAIPITMIVGIAKMEAATGPTQALNNTILLLAVAVFVVLMYLLTRSQRQTLKAEEDEVEHRTAQIAERYQQLHEELKGRFRRLRRRFLAQRITLWVIDISLLVIAVLSVLVFSYYGTPSVIAAKVTLPGLFRLIGFDIE